MRTLFLFAIVVAFSQFANAQKSALENDFHKYHSGGWTDYFIFFEADHSDSTAILLHVESERISVTISFRDKTILQQDILINAEDYQQFLIKIKESKIRRKFNIRPGNCSKGVAQSFRLMTKSKNNFVKFNAKLIGQRFKCEGNEYGNLRGDINKMIGAFKDLVPGYDEKIDSLKKAR
jgi:hypothetical protein